MCNRVTNHIDMGTFSKPVSDGFVTQLNVCTVVQTPHIYKKPIKNPRHRRGQTTPWQLRMTVHPKIPLFSSGKAPPLDDRLSASTEQLV